MRPYTDDRREALRDRVRAVAATLPRRGKEDRDGARGDDALRRLGDVLAEAGLFRLCVAGDAGGEVPFVEPLSLAVTREELAYASGAADALFAVQGLGAQPIAAAGSASLRAAWLPRFAAGEALAAFAVTEPEAGSDLAAVATRARPDGDGFVLDGTKVFISNATVGDLFVVLARTAGGPTAFAVPRSAAGVETSPIELLASHAVGAVRLRGVRVAAEARLGAEGEGLALCLRTLELFRPTVGAAACGLARRALDEARRRVTARHAFGGPLAEQQTVRFALAEAATSLEAARGLVYRAAWLKEEALRGGAAARQGAPAAMAKLFATEAAQEIVDRAVQLHGAAGLVRGSVVEALYREVRALRIYEGTSEIQKLVIARELLARGAEER